MTGKSGSYHNDLDQHLSKLHDIAEIPVLTGFGVSTLEDVDRFNQVQTESLSDLDCQSSS